MEGLESRPSVRLLQMIQGFRLSQALHVAAVLGIADVLKDGPRSSEDLAAATGAHPGTLYRLLRALAAAGVFHEEDDRRFALTSLGACLRSDVPESVGPGAVLFGQPDLWQAWGDLLHSVKTGECAYRHVHGMSNWEYRARHPEAGAIFDRSMGNLTHLQADAVLAAYDFGRFDRVVDVGGGLGTFLAALLARHPGTRGVLFDQPRVVARAEPVLATAGVFDRCEVVGGSFFETVPAGADAYVLKNVLLDWADPEATAILRTCREAMGAEARLLVVDAVVGPPNGGVEEKFLDLAMLVMAGGQARTADEWASLFAGAGFRLAGVAPTRTYLSVFEGGPA